MKNVIAVIALAMGTICVSFGQTTGDMTKQGMPQKFIEMISGTWKLKSIVDAEAKKAAAKAKSQSKKGTLANENPPEQSNNAMEMMEFNPNARYKMNSAVAAVDSGSYRVNEQHGVLYLDSDGSNDPSEWTISIRKDILTLGGRTDADKRYTYVYERVKEGIRSK